MGSTAVEWRHARAYSRVRDALWASAATLIALGLLACAGLAFFNATPGLALETLAVRLFALGLFGVGAFWALIPLQTQLFTARARRALAPYDLRCLSCGAARDAREPCPRCHARTPRASRLAWQFSGSGFVGPLATANLGLIFTGLGLLFVSDLLHAPHAAAALVFESLVALVFFGVSALLFVGSVALVRERPRRWVGTCELRRTDANALQQIALTSMVFDGAPSLACERRFEALRVGPGDDTAPLTDPRAEAVARFVGRAIDAGALTLFASEQWALDEPSRPDARRTLAAEAPYRDPAAAPASSATNVRALRLYCTDDDAVGAWLARTQTVGPAGLERALTERADRRESPRGAGYELDAFANELLRDAPSLEAFAARFRLDTVARDSSGAKQARVALRSLGRR